MKSPLPCVDESGVQSDDIGDVRQPAQRIVIKVGEAPEGIGDSGDLVDVVRIAVSERRDLANGVGDGQRGAGCRRRSA